MRKTLVALCATFCVGTASAAFWDGNRLLAHINDDTSHGRGMALGYIMGVHDSMENINHCTPSNVMNGQVRDIVRNYLTNTPAERHEVADSLVLKALAIAFPCAGRSGGKRL